MANESTLSELQAENARLIALLEANGIDWRLPVLGSSSVCESLQHYETSVLSSSEKVTLFRQLFRGREDVYPIRWDSKTTGKSGYAPACGNEWIPGICNKPRIKCGDCQHRSLLPITDKVIYDHLAGNHTVGIFPLLEDDTCYFLAVDFDEEDWREDIKAFMQSCEALGVPVAAEISRSGQGAHAWIFFSGKVPAVDARRLGTAIISLTCSRTRQLTLKSYDRLFPNQDRMPKGGFGNLIALPLQKWPRGNGHSVFVDSDLVPYSDQWGFLATIKKMSAHDIEPVILQATDGNHPLQTFLNTENGVIGRIGGGKNKPSGLIDIAVMQSLSRLGEVNTIVENYGQVIVDECHHIGAVSFDAILKKTKAKYVLGLTATPIRRDGQQALIFMQCGPIRHKASQSLGAPQDLEVFSFSLHSPIDVPADAGIQEVFRHIANDTARNHTIVAESKNAFAQGHKILVLTERVEHLLALQDAFEASNTPCFILHGRMSKKQRTTLIVEIEALQPDEPRILLATGKLVGEGFDHPPLDTLVLAMPISWKGTLQQYAGRLHRVHAGKTSVRVFDFVDTGHPTLLRMWEKRQSGYKAMGYRISVVAKDATAGAEDKHSNETTTKTHHTGDSLI